MTISPEQFERIHQVGNFENPPQRDGTGRITGMQRQHPFVDVSIVYEEF
ncbi:MAG: hypothetical protein HYT10_00715 [Candidatus Levybacteria bacterium]|nr:hypothetical protein [Candidatus Levybacteria bacterium]